jgi:hypothetical protein
MIFGELGSGPIGGYEAKAIGVLPLPRAATKSRGGG